jgi:hypothetical protein
MRGRVLLVSGLNPREKPHVSPIPDVKKFAPEEAVIYDFFEFPASGFI